MLGSLSLPTPLAPGCEKLPSPPKLLSYSSNSCHLIERRVRANLDGIPVAGSGKAPFGNIHISHD